MQITDVVEKIDPIDEMKSLFRLGVKILRPAVKSATSGDAGLARSTLAGSMAQSVQSNDLQSVLQRGLASKSITSIGYSDDDDDDKTAAGDSDKSDSEWS